MPKIKEMSHDDNNEYDLREEKLRLPKTYLEKKPNETHEVNQISLIIKNIIRRN